ncbi:MAG: hypothetical protein H7A25_22010 [Leptospiraceae bacterium]|nr:hypothetical protein [Leptospiraceae bacterium]MCP5502589.1 hypothetical protein [Leptospiraceae bacterium]
MLLREKIKEEIDKIQEEHLDLLFEVILAFEKVKTINTVKSSSWDSWVEEMFGCFQQEPLQRYSQGQYEIREALQ